MRHYRIKEDLELVLNQNKPEPVIRVFWFDYKKGEAYREFVEAMIRGVYDEDGRFIPSEYEKLYPDYDEDGNPINYIEYDEVEIKFDPETGEEKIIPILPNECYEETEITDEFDNKTTEKIIKEDCRHRPTKELYLELQESNFNEPSEEELLPEYLEFIKPILVNRIRDLSDERLKDIKKLLAGRDITPEQEERYKIKYQKALKAKETKDYSNFELEAKIAGRSPEELVDLIIAMGQKWENKIDEYALVLDAVRIGIKNKIMNITSIEELDLINKKIKDLRSIPLTAAIDEYIKTAS